MSMFNKMLASIGIGSAKVDTRLEETRYYPGEEIRGVVHIRGGSVEQRIDGIYLVLLTRYLKEQNDRKVQQTEALEKFRLTGERMIGPGEDLEIPFQFQIPYHTPATFDRVQVWVRTAVDLDRAVDPGDEDYIDVLPHPHSGVVLEAIERLGFRIRKVENEYAPRYGRGAAFVQEFEFQPGPRYSRQLDELEAIFYPSESGVEVLLEIDRRARGFMGFMEEALDADESRILVRFSREELARGVDSVTAKLDELIRLHSRR